MKDVTEIKKGYEFKIGQKVYFKRKSNMHPNATYVGKVINIFPHFVQIEGFPMEETMEYKIIFENPKKCNYSISFASIGCQDVKVWVEKTA